MNPSAPVIALALAGLSACHIGPSVETFAPANGPDGVDVLLTVRGRDVEGELLEVRDTALLVLRNDRLLLVPVRAISIGRFGGFGLRIMGGRFIQDSHLRLQDVSRFPAGVTPEILTRLLAAYSQTEPDQLP